MTYRLNCILINVLFLSLIGCSKNESQSLKTLESHNLLFISELKFSKIQHILMNTKEDSDFEGVFSEFSEKEIESVVSCSFPERKSNVFILSNCPSVEGPFYMIFVKGGRLTCRDFISYSLGTDMVPKLDGVYLKEVLRFDGESTHEKMINALRRAGEEPQGRRTGSGRE